jgi:hypothetical protein
LIEEFLTAEIAQVQEKGEVQLSFSFAPDPSSEGDLENRPGLGAVEIEYGLNSRLQVSVELPVAEGFGLVQDDLEVGLGYRLLSTGRATSVVAAVGLSSNDLSSVQASLIAGTAVGNGEIHSAVTFEWKENDAVVQLAAVYPIHRWRALLECSGALRQPVRQITPGIAWQNDSLGFGAGVTLSRGLKPGVVLKATIEF